MHTCQSDNFICDTSSIRKFVSIWFETTFFVEVNWQFLVTCYRRIVYSIGKALLFIYWQQANVSPTSYRYWRANIDPPDFRELFPWILMWDLPSTSILHLLSSITQFSQLNLFFFFFWERESTMLLHILGALGLNRLFHIIELFAFKFGSVIKIVFDCFFLF